MIDCTPFIENLNSKPVAIFGLGLSGMATLKALLAAEGKVIVWDDREEVREQAAALGAEVKELTEEALEKCACLVLSPGVPLHFPEPHPVVTAAKAAKTEILCDIEILHRVNQSRNIPRKTIGITGTNGKSTTTALIHHILDECGVPNEMGGNIGTPALEMELPDRGGAFVLEMSSYQIDLCPSFRPDIAVLLNISPDHIERHGSMDGYVAAKAQMFEGQGSAIISIDDMHAWEVGEKVKDAGQRKVIDLHVNEAAAAELTAPFIRGAHNVQNALAARHVCKLLGVEGEKFNAALETFPGLNHRQYRVRQIEQVLYINDSKATNAEAAAKALSSYGGIYWIVGGQAKDGGLQGLESFAPRIRHAFLIGEASGEFERWMKENGVAYTLSETLENAVPSAHDMAQGSKESGIVLLSPACASWDQFKNFEARGDVFADIVNTL